MIKHKCFLCKKKLDVVSSVTNICKCSNVFCNDHKIQHECSYDKRKEYKDEIAKKMPKLFPQKVVIL